MKGLAARRALPSTVALVALTTAVSLQSFRVLFPKAYGLADRVGNGVAAAVTVAVFGSALLTPVVRQLLGGRRTLLAAVATLAAWRLVVGFVDTVPLGLALAGTVAALMASTLVLTSELAGAVEVKGVALLAGLGLDVVLRSAFLTWDPAWQRDAAPLAVALLLSAALVVSAWGAPDRDGAPAAVDGLPAVSGFGGGVAVGAVLALEAAFLLSPGFVASSASLSLAWSAFVVLAGLALGIAAFAFSGRLDGALLALATAGGLATVGYLLPRVSDGGAVFAVLAGQAGAGLAIGAATRERASSRLRAELGVGAGWVVFVLVVLLYQIHFDQPLPFDNRWVVAGAGALTVVAARGRVAPSVVRDHRPVAVAAASVLLAAVLVAAGLGATGVRRAVASRPVTMLRVVEWNVRQAVTENAGELAPQTIASVLARDGPPDIVVLPEAARGWPASGDLDLASWLSRRLHLPFAWGPAADHQFGTLVLSRLPILATHVVRLPVAGRSQGRSLLHATLDLGEGRRLTLLATHLQHRNDEASMTARLREIRLILAEWMGARRTVLVGDLNPRQGEPPQYPIRRPGAFPEIRALLDAGFTAAQDLDTCSQPTAGRNCSDFVLVTPDLHQEVTVLSGVEHFDHRPVRSVIRLA